MRLLPQEKQAKSLDVAWNAELKELQEKCLQQHLERIEEFNELCQLVE